MDICGPLAISSRILMTDFISPILIFEKSNPRPIDPNDEI